MKKINSLDAFNINKDDNGVRLDKVLLKKFENLSFIKLQKLIRVGFFKVNKKRVKPNYKVKIYDLVQYNSKLVVENTIKKNKNSSEIELKYNKKISETLNNSLFLKKISEKFANKGFNF